MGWRDFWDSKGFIVSRLLAPLVRTIIETGKNVNKLEEDGHGKKSSASFQSCRPGRRLHCLTYSLQAHRPRRRQSSGQWSLSKFQKQAIYFCLSNRARIWAFFGESAHEAARPPKSIWGCPPRLRLWAVQAASGAHWLGRLALLGLDPGVVIFEEIKM